MLCSEPGVTPRAAMEASRHWARLASHDNDGTLSVDSTNLDNAIQNNYSAVQQFFEARR